MYVYKEGNSQAHLVSEVVANALYRAADVRVPDVRIVLGRNCASIGQLTTFIEKGVGLGAMRRRGQGRRLDLAERAEAALCRDFLLDCLFANWDIVKGDNVLVMMDDPDHPIRLDNGGALLFRAQGASKPVSATEVPELRTMRRGYFAKITDAELRRQFARLSEAGAFDRILGVAPTPALRSLLAGRINSLRARLGSSAKKRNST